MWAIGSTRVLLEHQHTLGYTKAYIPAVSCPSSKGLIYCKEVRTSYDGASWPLNILEFLPIY